MANKTASPNLTRYPDPHDEDLEAVTLGALMIEQQAMSRVCYRLKPEMFFNPEHQEIYRAVAGLYEKGEPIDIVTVTEEMHKLGTIEKIGGPYLITLLTSRVTSSAHLEYHTSILTELYMRRELIRTNEIHTAGSMDMTIDLADQIDRQRTTLDIIENCVEPETLRTLGEVAAATLQEAAWRRENNKNGLTGIPTGLNELNRLTAGLQNGDLAILAGRPATGKTAVSLCMAWEAAEAGHQVLYCSIEMTAERLMDRWLVGKTGIDPNRWKGGQSTPEEMEKVLQAKEQIQHLPIRVDDNSVMSMDYIFSKARTLRQKGLCDIVFVDYLQLSQLKPGNRNDTRTAAIGEATRKAKLMARKLDIPVVLLSQLNRKPEDRVDKRPELADLRDSGQIEQDADLVMIVHRPAQAEVTTGILIVAKNRNGPVGDVYFGHNESLTRIGDHTPPMEWMEQNTKRGIDAKKLRNKYQDKRTKIK
jgi:replicative DNA helicase